MRFSIIIPVYKVEKYIDECIKSVLNQTFKDYEIILVDDGSPDNCPKICDDYASKYKNIKVLHKENGGLSDARNKGLEIARGEYIVFLDSDDFWDDNQALAKATSLIKNESDVDVILFQVKQLMRGKIDYPDGQYDADKINNSTLEKAIEYLISKSLFRPSAWCRLIRRDLLIKNNIQFTKGLLSEDFDWIFALFEHVKKLKALPDPIYIYRKREGSISTSISEKNLNDLLWIIEKWSSKLKEYENKNIQSLMNHYLGFIFAMFISMIHFSSKPSYYLKKIKPFLFLLNFNLNPKTNKVKNLIIYFGIYPTYYLLSLRNRWKFRPK